jgi:hypothetical protein
MTAIRNPLGEFGARVGSVEHLRPIVADLERRITAIRERRSDSGSNARLAVVEATQREPPEPGLLLRLGRLNGS